MSDNNNFTPTDACNPENAAGHEPESVHVSREDLADAEFENYFFGEGETVVQHGRWDLSDPSDLTKVAYLMSADQDPGSDSEKVSFHVRFADDGAVSEAYGLLCRTGAEIGERGVTAARRAEMGAMSETWSAGDAPAAWSRERS